MTKILTDEKYRALKAKADGYDEIVASIMNNNEGLTAEDVTLDSIRELLNSGSQENTSIADLKSELHDVTSERDSLRTQLNEMKEENDKLKNLPGADTVTKAKPHSDSGAEKAEDSLLAFARKHEGDTLAIIAEMRKKGY